jgi:hypothetical protein
MTEEKEIQERIRLMPKSEFAQLRDWFIEYDH